MNTKAVGDKSEATALARFVNNGWTVLMPFGDNKAYDLVIDRGAGFERVQVKTGRQRKGCIEFNAYRTVGRVGNGVEIGYTNEADLFAVVYGQNVYLLPVASVGTSKVFLRIAATNVTRSNIRWAEQFVV